MDPCVWLHAGMALACMIVAICDVIGGHKFCAWWAAVLAVINLLIALFLKY